MGGVLLLCGYLFAGVLAMEGLIPRRTRLVRLWMGFCAGLGLMMWLPALLAFFLRFTRDAQWLGLAMALGIGGACALAGRGKTRDAHWTDMPLWLPLALVIPLALLGGYLQFTHTLRAVEGELHVGQSTYGDLCLHLGIATSLRDAAFPPDYSLLPGTRLGYPFLADSMVTSMLLCGSPLTFSYVLTGTLMMVLTFLGFVIFCWEYTHSPAATVLATALMFVNGGLGFLYSLDQVFRDPTAFHNVFTGFYKTPTNQPDLNLRWVNVICDMMVPQRTLLAGWTMLLPALFLLVLALRERRAGTFALLGVWSGMLPLIHTHSFLALGLCSAGAMIYTLLRTPSGERGGVFVRFMLFGGLAVLLAMPQLIEWAFPQTVNGGSMRFLFNWVNNQDNGRLIDFYGWFWIKNVGLIWLMMIPAALTGKKGGLRRTLGCGALLIYIIAELFRFQPNTYDNNKLFYVAYIIMTPAVGLYLCRLWRALRGVRGRAVLAAAFIAASTLSGALSIGREAVSDYRLFSAEEANAAAFIEDNLPADATFLTGQQHNNAVAALTGRDIVCGTGSYLYFHGVDYSRQQYAARRMLETPGDNPELFGEYGVDFVYLSSWERASFAIDYDWYAENTVPVYANTDVSVRAVSDAAKALAAEHPEWNDTAGD